MTGEPIVWGLDVSSLRVALAVREGERSDVSTLALPKGEGARRLGGALRELLPWVQRARELGAPEAVFVEMPFSKERRQVQALQQTMGVVLAGLEIALRPAPPIVTLTPAQWKSAAMGRGQGHAPKPAVLAWAREELRYQGVCCSCGAGGEKCRRPEFVHDEADALGVATAGQLIVRRKLQTDRLRVA